MEIKTKFNIGDIVIHTRDNETFNITKILKISISNNEFNDDIIVYYRTSIQKETCEVELFSIEEGQEKIKEAI